MPTTSVSRYTVHGTRCTGSRLPCTVHLAPCTLVLLVTACAPDSSPAWSGTITDSAGVAIVANPATPIWESPPGVTVLFTAAETPEPIGNITAVARRADGHLFVVDDQAQKVHEFDGAGAFVRTIGRPGRGPGELTDGLDAAWFVGDTLHLNDISAQRIARYAPDGAPLAPIPLPLASGVSFDWTSDSTGRLVHGLAIIQGPQAGATALVERNGAGVIVDTLLALPTSNDFDVTETGPQLTIFAPSARWDMGWNGTIFAGTTAAPDVGVYTPDGTLRMLVRWPQPARGLTDRDREVWREAMLKLWEGRLPPFMHQGLRQNVRFHDAYPAYADLMAGPDGTLWVNPVRTADQIPDWMREALDAERDVGGPRWMVFDREGRYLGDVDLPQRFTPMVFYGNEIFGVIRDELDVQSLMGVRVDWD